jgi:hypothetical protein
MDSWINGRRNDWVVFVCMFFFFFFFSFLASKRKTESNSEILSVRVLSNDAH